MARIPRFVNLACSDGTSTLTVSRFLFHERPSVLDMFPHTSRKTTIALSFTSLALRTVIDPEIKSSTYSSLRIFFTTSGSFSSQLLRCAWMTSPRRKGEEVSPKSALVNRRVVKGECHWKRLASGSASLILT